jgi:hypothetical protein
MGNWQSWGQQQQYAPYGYVPYYQGYNPYAPPVYGYPAYPVNPVPDYNVNPVPDYNGGPAMPVPSPLGGDNAVGMVPSMTSAADAAADEDEDSKKANHWHRPCNDHIWLSTELLLGWIQPQHVPPLATTGSPLDAHPGALGQPNTATLFGGNNIDPGITYGLRGDFGIFVDNDARFSLDIGGLYLAPDRERFTAVSDAAGNPIIARPFFNVVLGRESAFVNSLPGLASGGISIASSSEMAGAELNASFHNYSADRLHTEALFGFRYMRLAESLTINDQLSPLTNTGGLTFLGNPIGVGDSLSDEDRFRTINDFYGIQIGGRVQWEGDWFFVSGFGKIALGATNQQVDIDGQTVLTSAAGSQAAEGGILALPSNIGHHSRVELGYMPEGGINIGIKVCPHVQLVAGYSFLYWNAVARPGNQIDLGVNPARVPSDTTFGQSGIPARPAFSFNDDSFWVQTLNLGIEIRY